jgi:hypothetical protein
VPRLAAVLTVAAVLLFPAPRGLAQDPAPLPASGTLPVVIDDVLFWQMARGFSERPGTFPSDNLLSNEHFYQDVVPALEARASRNGVYLGVGPEQNFTYIAAVRPSMAFIFDVRQGNFNLHLLYKALFELAADRADFVSLLFARPRPDALTAASSLAEIFDAVAATEQSQAVYARNMQAIVRVLTRAHGFELFSSDMLRLQQIYRSFHRFGPDIQYSSTGGAPGSRFAEPTYRELMLAGDRDGHEHSFLASEDAFAFLKAFEAANRLVPVVGNFAGRGAIRAVAAHLRRHGATVSAFYLSNVEEYLRQDGVLADFCANAAELPIDAASVFIRAKRGARPELRAALAAELTPLAADVERCE